MATSDGETTTRRKPHFTLNKLSKLSGIPHIRKLAVKENELVELMIAIQLNIEEERRLTAEKIVLYDPHYLSGLIELPSPNPSVTAEPGVVRWPLMSPKGRRKRQLQVLESVVEEPELGRYVTNATNDYIISTQLLFESDEHDERMTTPSQIESICPKDVSANESVGDATADETECQIAAAFPNVPCSAKSMPALTDGSSTTASSERSTSDTSVFSAGQPPRSLRRAQSESSVYSQLTQRTSASLHLYSPWIEELDVSFGLNSKSRVRGLDTEYLEISSKPSGWARTPEVTRNQSMTSHRGDLGRYRTLRMTSTSL